MNPEIGSKKEQESEEPKGVLIDEPEALDVMLHLYSPDDPKITEFQEHITWFRENGYIVHFLFLPTGALIIRPIAKPHFGFPGAV